MEKNVPLSEIHNRIVHEAVRLPADTKLKRSRDRVAFALYNVLTADECKRLIEITEQRGYVTALVNSEIYEDYRPDYRNGDRCIWDNPEEAEQLWNRIKPWIPAVWTTSCHKWNVLGVNERLRCLRYDKGGFFKAHFDECYVRNDSERSFITIQVYLNEGYEGGETTFLGDPDVPYVPRVGSVLVFEHEICHEGSLLKKGRKYTIRSDIQYKIS